MANAPREIQTRENQTREVEQFDEYRPPSTLPEPLPREGIAHRWVMTHVLGTLEPTGTSTRMREGWEPVKAADYPEMAAYVGRNGNVELGGLMLCACPEGRMRARDAYYAKQAAGQMESVDNSFMRNNDPRMPLFADKRSEVKFGVGSK